MPIKMEGWACGYCPKKKIYRHKSYVARHESRCVHNPANRACATCRHLAYFYHTVYVKAPDPGSLDYEEKRNACIHPIEVVADTNSETMNDKHDPHLIYGCDYHETRPPGWVKQEAPGY